MNTTWTLILKIIAVAFAAAGILIIALAPKIAQKRGLIEKKKIDPKLIEHMSPEEQQKYRIQTAVLDVKLFGMLVGTPGFILILVVFS